jgi:site-specific recombinase XerD
VTDDRRDLEPLEPEHAVEMYFSARESELSAKTVENHTYRLRSFVAFCEEHDIDNLNELTGRDLYEFIDWRKEGRGDYDPVSKVTLDGILSTLIVFLKFAEKVDAVPEGLHNKVLKPDLTPADEVSDAELGAERAQEILTYLEKYKYASRDHVIFAILWHTGMRLGSLRALDVEDFGRKEKRGADFPAYLELHHRPETETPLKNKESGERVINVGEHYAEVIEDYLKQNRDTVTDEYGRRPLITSSRGRLTENPIRVTVYRLTQPCEMKACPHDKEPETCEWRNKRDQVAGCPSSRSPHAIRTGSTTYHLNTGTPPEVVSERCDVSQEILEKHYDKRDDREKMELRGEHLEI